MLATRCFQSLSRGLYSQEALEVGSKHARQSLVYIPSAPQRSRKRIQPKLMTHEGPTAVAGPCRDVDSSLGFFLQI